MNPYIVWQDKYSVNSPTIDAQHSQLVDIINSLYHLSAASPSAEELKIQLDRLRIYTETHFKYEETILKILRYPDYEKHRRGHQKMLLTTKSMINDVLTTGNKSCIELLAFLKDWWNNHIIKTDKKYNKYVKPYEL